MAVSVKTKLLFLILLALNFARIVSGSLLLDPQNSEEIQLDATQSIFNPLESELEVDLEAGSLMSNEPPYREDDWSKQRAMGWDGWYRPWPRSDDPRWEAEEKRILKEMEERNHRKAMEQLQKDNELKRAQATKELAWFVVTALLPLLVIFIFKLRSVAISARKEKIHHDNPCINRLSFKAKSL